MHHETDTFLEYPELEGDEARRGIWLHDSSLTTIHQLRAALNNSKVDYREILPKFEIPIVASVLKLYLLELPGILLFNTNISLNTTADSPRLSCFFSSLRNRQDYLLDHRSRDYGRGTDQGPSKHTWTTPSRQYRHA